MTAVKRIAVLFPGIGYHCDKPLLYYSGKLAAARGYEVVKLSYTDMPQKVRGDRSKMEQAFYMGLDQARDQLKEIDWTNYQEILFVGKSVGTIIASAYAQEKKLIVKNVLFTPLKDTFAFAGENAICFHGTEDPWAENADIEEGCRKRNIPLHLTDHANHSLETGDVLMDLGNLRATIKLVDAFISAPLIQRTMELEIRKCTISDHIPVTIMYNDVVWNLNHHVNYPKWTYNEYPGYETVRLAIVRDDLYGCWDGDRCVGAFIMNHLGNGDYESPDWSRKLSPEDYLVIHTLGVDPKSQGQGIARQMLTWAEEYARKQGMQALRVDAVPDNYPAEQLFLGMGLPVSGIMT